MQENNSARAIGFFRLTPIEAELLLAFDPHTRELLQPEQAGAGKQAYSAIKTLLQKGLVAGNRPYKLSAAGRRVRKVLLSQAAETAAPAEKNQFDF